LSAGQAVAVYDGGTRLGYALPNQADNTWNLQLTAPLSSGAHSITARVEWAANGLGGVSSAPAEFHVQGSPRIGTVEDNAGPLKGELGRLPQSTSARYVRLDVDASAVDALRLSEVEVWAWVEGVRTNVALNKTLTSRYANGSLSLAVDGNIATTLQGADFAPALHRAGRYANDWVMVDLGSAYVIDAVVLRTPSTPEITVSAANIDLSSYISSEALAADPRITRLSSTLLGLRSGDWNAAQTLVTDDGTPALSGTLDAALRAGEQLAVFVGGVYRGAATVTDLNWRFTPDATLAEGSWSVQVRVLDAQGRVVSVSESITLQVNSGASPTAVASITGFVDNVGSAIGTFSAGASTDDATPTLRGTLNAALKTGEVLAVFDTVGGNPVRLGNATVSGTTWTFIPLDALAPGSHSLTARVENTATQALGSPSAALGLAVQTLEMTRIADDVGASQGNVLASPGLDASRYVRISRDSGLLNVAEVQVWARNDEGELVNVALGKSVLSNLPGVSGSGGDQAVDGNAASSYGQDLLPQAATTGNGFNAPNWLQIDLGQAVSIEKIVLVPTAGAADRLAGAVVAASLTDMRSLSDAQVSATPSIVKQTVSSTAAAPASGLELGGWSQQFAGDDSTPVLSGKLAAPLGVGESLAVYDDGQLVGLATVSLDSGQTLWRYDFGASGKSLSTGSHRLEVRVQDALGNARLSLTETLVVDSRPGQSYGLQVTGLSVLDDAGTLKGTVAAGALTDDRQLTLNVSLNNSLTDGVHRVAVYDNGSFLGYASGSGTTYSFTNSGLLGFGTHTLEARIVNTVTGRVGDASLSQSVVVQAVRWTEIVDDVGGLSGNALSRVWNFGLDPDGGGQGYTRANPGGLSSSDDRSPLLKGTLGVALEETQQLDVYAGSVRLGQATVDGTGWHYQLTPEQALATGIHSLTAQIVNKVNPGNALLVSDAASLTVLGAEGDLSALNTVMADNLTVFSFSQAGQTLDLTKVSGAAQPRIDQINLTGLGFPNGGGNTVRLSLDDVLQGSVGKFLEGSGFTGLAADGRKQMMLSGIPGGTVEVVGESSAWQAAGQTTRVETGEVYNIYNSSNGAAQLLIDSDLTRLGAVL
jgi:hypothetical protein